MEKITFTVMSVEELKDLIAECAREAIQNYRMDREILEKEREEELLTTAELAEYLGVSKPTIHAWKMAGKLPFYRLGRRVYFKKSEILKGF